MLDPLSLPPSNASQEREICKKEFGYFGKRRGPDAI
jgi:hypothetical protein